MNEWANIVAAASARNLYLMPYLEYGGSQGNNCLPGQTPAWPCDKTPGNYFSLGYQHRPVKLFDGIFMPGGDKNDVPGFLHNYTGTYWTENLAADVTDPDIRTDLHFLIDRIAGQYKDTAKFAGIWLRTRQTKLPMSFSAATIARYNAANPAAPRTLVQLQSNEASRQAYYDWWYKQRASLLEDVRDYTRSTLGDKTPQVLFTAYATEPVPGATASATSQADWVSLVTDNPDAWQAYVDKLFVGFSAGQDESNDPYRWYRWAWGRKTPTEALAERIQKNGLDKTVPLPTFPSADPAINSCVTKISAFVANGGNTPWECWQEEAMHATPPADPKNYQGKEGVAMTYEFGNALYSVADVPLLNEYSGSAGQSLIHHYPLNEDEGSSFNDGSCANIYAMDDQQPFDGKVGYISVSTERAGPFSTLAEARALANGNPINLGYLESSSMSRGFPAYVKRFNQALLSLPALPAIKMTGQTSDDEVVLKKIASSAGTYYAVINTAMTNKTGTVVDFGAGTAQVKDLLNNTDYTAQKLSFDLYPGEVRTFRAP
ncbi:MAG: hypothetical protein EOO68_13310 [Moraxellaceae bacterium]|nr:MAG: hypothetical protein EOO68_13310 [Moraxellaceae bacterium]